MPTVPDTVYSNKWLMPLFHPEDARMTPAGLKGPTNATYPEYPAGVLLGEITASLGTFAPYNPGATDGTQNPKLINRVPVSVDSSGHIAWPGDHNNVNGVVLDGRKFIDVYRSGDFRLDEIIGLDANALAIMQGKVDEGVIGTNEKDTVTLSAATNTWDVAITGADSVAHTFLALSGAISAATLQALLDAVFGIGGVKVTLSGLIYTFWFGGAWGNQPVTVASTPHTITSTDARVVTGAAATVPSGAHGAVAFAS